MIRLSLFLVLFALLSCKTTAETRPLSKSAEFTTAFHEGIRLKLFGNYEKAIESFNKCLKEDPGNDAAHYALAQTYLLQGNLLEAKTHTLAASSKDEKNIFYQIELAYMYRELSDFELSANTFERITIDRPNVSIYYFETANSWYLANKRTKAISVLDRLDLVKGPSVESCVKKHHCYREIGDNKKAENELRKIYEKEPANVYVISTLVDFYHTTGQKDRAIEFLNILVNVDPENGLALILLGEYEYDNNNIEKAEEFFLKALVSGNLYAPEVLNALRFLFYQNNRDKMEQGLSYAEQGYIENDTVMEFVGDHYYNKEDFEKAISSYTKGVEANPGAYSIWEKLLYAHYDLQDWNRLIKDSKKAQRTFPLKPFSYYMLSVGYNQTKQYLLAKQTAEEGAEIAGMDGADSIRVLEADLLGQLGESNFGLGEFEEAKDNYLKAIELSRDAENSYLTFNFCFRLYEHGKELELALELINNELASSLGQLDTYEFLLLKGDVFFRQEKYKESLEVYEKLREIYPENPVVFERTGDAYAKLNNLNEALVFWKEAQKLGSTNALLQKKIDDEAYFE